MTGSMSALIQGAEDFRRKAAHRRALSDALTFVREKLEEYKEKGELHMVSRAIDAEAALEWELAQ